MVAENIIQIKQFSAACLANAVCQSAATLSNTHSKVSGNFLGHKDYRKMLKETENGVIINCKISPNASKNEIIKTDDGIKIKITAQPVDGKANKALIEFLSKQLKIPKTSIEILKGHTSKEKTVLIKNCDQTKKEQLKSLLMI